MDILALLFLSAACVALLWHGVRWALKADRKGKHRKRKPDPALDAAFFELIRPLWKHPRD